MVTLNITIVPFGSSAVTATNQIRVSDSAPENQPQRPLYTLPLETVRLEPSVLNTSEVEVI